MKKLFCVLLVPLCILVVWTGTSLADEWDFLHTAMWLSSPELLPELMEKSGCDFGPMHEISGGYFYEKPTLWGVPAQGLSLLEMPIKGIGGFLCYLSFDAPADSSPDNPGDTHASLTVILTEKYGEPTREGQSDDEKRLRWDYQDATVDITWWLNPDTKKPEVTCVWMGSETRESDSARDMEAFPFAPLDLSTPLSPPDGFSLLRVRPGMTREEVIAAMGREPDQISNNLLLYAEQGIAMRTAFVAHSFSPDGIFDHTLVSFPVSSDDPADSIEDYERVKTVLTYLHGEPREEKISWHKDRYKDDPTKHGEALRQGDVSYRAVWLVDEVQIILELNADESGIWHGLWYYFVPGTAPKLSPPAEPQDGLTA